MHARAHAKYRPRLSFWHQCCNCTATPTLEVFRKRAEGLRNVLGPVPKRVSRVVMFWARRTPSFQSTRPLFGAKKTAVPAMIGSLWILAATMPAFKAFPGEPATALHYPLLVCFCCDCCSRLCSFELDDVHDGLEDVGNRGDVYERE